MLLNWAPGVAAAHAGVPVDDVNRAERSPAEVSTDILNALRASFETAGILFFAVSESGSEVALPSGAGVLMRDGFQAPSDDAVPWQVRRTEQFVNANWNQPITIDSIAQAVGASPRAIFSAFAQSRGYSPMDYTKRVRLEHAQAMLSEAGSKQSIAEIARACGFGNAGHFAADYQRTFGERPSETRRRSR